MSNDPSIEDHQRWLGYLQPEGLVVSPAALVDCGLLFDRNNRPLHQRFLEHLATHQGWILESDAPATLTNLRAFLTQFLDWPEKHLVGEGELPPEFRIPLPGYQEALQPTLAVRHPREAGTWLLLIQEIPRGTSLETPGGEVHTWQASPTRKFERLLRDTRVPVGILSNGESLQLIYAPPGENVGALTFQIADMAQIAGRPILSGLHLLLEKFRVFGPEADSLHTVLRKSREFQAHVSTQLAGQVLSSLYDLCRGLQDANIRTGGGVLRQTMADKPDAVYEGITSVLMRLVFLLFVEDKGLAPASQLYQENYSLHGLYDQLRRDHERYPDTMDHRYGAWARLLVLFRLIHRGSAHPEMRLPARSGFLFDPNRFPFLEGRNERGELSDNGLPLISDAAIFSVLQKLLFLEGERLSYRTLDVEQIGSVYETIMGFRVEIAPGRMIALKPKNKHGAPVHLSLDELLAKKPAEREKLITDETETKLPEAAGKGVKAATTLDDLLAALDKRIDRRATPQPVAAGSIILQPTDERRRSGSHYTPRSFTEPIVRKTLEPILDRLGRHPKPETLLDLKIADIAVGSAAFLVETCRQLADELVATWHYHRCLPVIPPDEDELLYARRLVAQRCLYGVDRNPMAVDLAKLSLWLATMAKDHLFTFVDHAIKCGDSLVGLTNRQIAAFHWDLTQATDRVFGQEKLEQQIAKVAAARKSILDWTEDTEAAVLKKRDFLAAAEAAASALKTTGDLVIAAFFAGDKPKQRQDNRDEFLHCHLELQKGDAQQNSWDVNTLKQLRGGEFPIRPFHWEIEFPEVFSRENPGFDAIVGNPPFAGKNTLINANASEFVDWLKETHSESHGNADLVAHFFRKAFNIINDRGTFGFIATNTIGQGDTRGSGLRWICVNGGNIYAARKRVKWPGEAAVIVSIIWAIKGECPLARELDGRQVPFISAYLFHAGGHQNPHSLVENSGKSVQGPIPLGMGFTFDDTDIKGVTNSLGEMKNLIERDPRNSQRIFPYVAGGELNESPTHAHHRFVISFADFPLRRETMETTWTAADTSQRSEWMKHGIVPLDYPLEVASDWPDLLALVERKVRPTRITDKRESYRRYWWQFAEKRRELFDIQTRHKRLLVHAYVSQHLAFTFVPSNIVVAGPQNIFFFDGHREFTILQSRLHEAWVRFFGSTLEDRMSYTRSDCFETFPFPPDWESNSALESAGREYYEYRAALMVRHDEGLTKTYNRFHDPEERSPDIHQLRTLHAAMDRAVLAAYGWTDLPTTCEFLLDYEADDDTEATGRTRQKKKPWRYRWPDEIRDEVLARLLALNAERHAEEVRLGIAPGMKKTGAKSAKSEKTQREKGADEMI